MRNRTAKRLLAILLSVMMIAGLQALTGGYETAHADTDIPWEKTVAGLSPKKCMCAYVPGQEERDTWSGSFVWFGTYGNVPIKYRVLALETTAYGGKTMLLDCNNVIFTEAFDNDGYPNAEDAKANEWKYSDLKSALNGSSFLYRENGFTDQERNAIMSSYAEGRPLQRGSDWTKEAFVNYVGLTGEKIFVLDSEEVSGANGYAITDGEGACRVKTDMLGTPQKWWLRSAGSGSNSAAGYVAANGELLGKNSNNVKEKIGVSPAFNVNLSSIVLVSAVKGYRFTNDTEYKFTLADSNITASVTSGQSVSVTGNTVTVPYTVSGSRASNVTQMSVLIIDKEYQTANANDANILYYSKLTGTFSKTGTGTFTLPSDLALNDWGSSYYVYILAEDVNDRYLTDYASSPVKIAKPVSDKTIISAKAKNAAILKGTAQEFEVVTSKDVQNLMLYAEGGSPLVKTWAASGNSTVSGNTRKWTVSHTINTAGDRKLVIKGGTTNTTPVTNAVTVPFKVENTGVISVAAKNSVIKKGGEQVFTVKTTSDAKYLVEYAESGNKVITWTASSSNSTVSGNVRTWTVKQNIGTAGKRTLAFKAGTTTTPTSVQKTASFTVEDVWFNSASAKYATIGKGGTQTFTVKTTSNAQYLMLYGEGGNLVKTWPASGNSTVSGSERTWTVNLAIGTVGNRELVLRAGKTTTPGAYSAVVKFAVVEKKLISAKAKYASITKTTTQEFEVVTSSDVNYLMLYAEGGNLVKSWMATPTTGIATDTAQKTRKWTVSLAIGTAGDRKLVFKGGTTNTTPVTNAVTVSFKVENLGAISASAKYPTIVKGGEQVFTVKTTSDSKYLVEYAEDGKTVVKTWTASASNSTVSSGVRTWTLPQTINTAGNRKLYFKAGSSSTTLAGSRVSAAFTVVDSVKINETNFPDEIFRTYVKDNFDTDKNGEFSAAELQAVESITTYRKAIYSLKGIEFFTELEVLVCYSNPIASLDLSGNTKLESLDCSGMQLTALDVSKNTELTYLECGFNQLTELDLRNNKELKTLYCACNKLEALDLSANTKLENLYCYSNKIKSLNVSKCTRLVYFHCHDNKLTSLIVPPSTALKDLNCCYNSITTLDVSKNTALKTLTVDTGVTVTGAGDNVTIKRN